MVNDFGTLELVHYTMFLRTDNQAIAPDPTACAVWNTGDVNLDLFVTPADIIHVVNYVFKGGFSPSPCPAAADVNCSGQVTSSDLINLVNYIFKGGQSPCDVCTLIPGTWGCPPWEPQ
jgi:hypothetical protein